MHVHALVYAARNQAAAERASGNKENQELAEEIFSIMNVDIFY